MTEMDFKKKKEKETIQQVMNVFKKEFILEKKKIKRLSWVVKPKKYELALTKKKKSVKISKDERERLFIFYSKIQNISIKSSVSFFFFFFSLK